MRQFTSINYSDISTAINIIKKIQPNIDTKDIHIIGATFEEDGTLTEYTEIKILCDKTNGNKDFYIFLTCDDLLSQQDMEDKFQTFLTNGENGFNYNNIIWKKYQNIDIAILN